jgi:hypothetical protein
MMRPRDRWSTTPNRGRDVAPWDRDYGQADYDRDERADHERRARYRADQDYPDREDYGQADYSEDYVYDPDRRRGVRREKLEAQGYDPDRPEEWRGERRTWDRPSAFGRDLSARDTRPHGRRPPSDRVIWAVVTERIDRDRRLDSSDIEVLVLEGEVTLNGTVRDRDDKRLAEDLAESADVRHVQNNLRVRERSGWRRWF